MKTLTRIKIFLALLLSLQPICMAQTTVNCDTLRDMIEQVKQRERNAASPSMRQMYNNALLKLYTDLEQCVMQEIALATETRMIVAGTSAAPGVEEKLRELQNQKSDIDLQLVRLRTGRDVANPPAADPVAGAAERPQSEDRVDAERTTRRVDEAAAAPETATTATTTTTAASAAAAQAPCQPGEAYADAPELLSDIVTRNATDVANDENNAGLANVPRMILYATLDASSPASSEMLRSLKAYQHLSETARTDKQLGASAKSDGAVSAIEKAGFARLLGLAIEHGGINKKNDGTNLTLSTSLYSLYTINKEDTAETYASAGVLNRVGVAASFAVDNKDDELANVRRNNLSEWSVKARLFGDRSTRSPEFQTFWDAEVAPLIEARLVAVGEPIEALLSNNVTLRAVRVQVSRCMRDAVAKRRGDADYQAATDAQQAKILSDLLLGILKSNVYDRIKSGEIKLDGDAITAIETRYVPNLKAALDNLKTAEGEIAKKLETLKKGPLGTFAYTNHRQPNASDYSEAKFLFEQEQGFAGPLKLIGNFGVSFYHKPDAALQQERLRDVTAALSFEGKSASPFTEAENQSKITYSFVGRYERLFENRRRPDRKPDIATAQFLMEIPFFRGLSLPLSLTYANATEEERKKNVRFNFGMRLDTDKLFELLKLPSSN